MRRIDSYTRCCRNPAEEPAVSSFKADPRNAAQRKMLDLVSHWQKTYNSKVENMILDCYAKDAHVCFTGGEASGHEQFMRIEKAVVSGCPGRYMRVDRVLFSGDATVVVEAVVLDHARPDYHSSFCAILTVRDGRIVQDHTYLDPSNWPGIEGAVQYVTPGGLGLH
jgi:ketosteroid isomerase-like protein